MFLLKKSIVEQPFILLGICFLIIGFTNLLFRVFNTGKTRNKNKYGVRESYSERKYSKQLQAISLIAILIGVIALIFWLRKQ